MFIVAQHAFQLINKTTLFMQYTHSVTDYDAASVRIVEDRVDNNAHREVGIAYSFQKRMPF